MCVTRCTGRNISHLWEGFWGGIDEGMRGRDRVNSLAAPISQIYCSPHPLMQSSSRAMDVCRVPERGERLLHSPPIFFN